MFLYIFSRLFIYASSDENAVLAQAFHFAKVIEEYSPITC